MNKFKKITDQELLQELKQRMANFTPEEFMKLMVLMEQHEERVLEVIQTANPQIYDWIQEKNSQLEQEKTEKEIDKIKQSLEDNK